MYMQIVGHRQSFTQLNREFLIVLIGVSDQAVVVETLRMSAGYDDALNQSVLVLVEHMLRVHFGGDTFYQRLQELALATIAPPVEQQTYNPQT